MKIIVAVLVLVSACSFAQQTDFNGNIKWSEMFPVSKKILSPDIIGHDGKSIYLSRFLKGKRHLEKYAINTLTLEKSVEAELTYNEKELALVGQFMLGDKPTLLTSFYNKKTKISYLFLQTIDPSSLALSAPKKIAENYASVSFNFMPYNSTYLSSVTSSSLQISENGQFGFAIGNDITAETSDEDIKAGNYNLKGILVGGDGEVVAESKFKMPYSNFITIQTKVADDGGVYMLGYELVTDADAPKRMFGGERMKIGAIHLLVLDVASGEIFTYDPEMEGRQVEMLAFSFSEDGGVNIGGLSSTEGKGVNGSFFMKLDKDFNEVGSTVSEFETDFITASWSEKKKEDLEKKQDKGKNVDEPQMYNYYIDHLISKPDGSCLMLAEQYYVRVVTHTYTTANGGTQTTTTYYYYYNDIIAINYDKNGDLAWKTVIHKKQVSTNDGGYYSSYFVVPDGNDIQLIYNDREINYVDTEGMSGSELKALSRSTIGAKVTLSADGEISKEKLFEFEEGGLRLVPKVCDAAGEDLVFLYARSTKGDKIGVIEFE
ncbi:MAG: hypothetical protein HYZ14_06600 [Bacteroidetes bacterium]|nr:hypothetical protein [Bacteroidota bacterium]